MNNRNIHTRVERRCLKLLRPFLIDLDGGGVILRVLTTKSQVVGMLDEGGELVRVGGVHHIEEELAVRQVGLGALLGEEFRQVLHDVGDEADYTQLVKLGHLDGSKLTPWNEMLPTSKHFFQKVLRDLLPGRHVELACK